MKMLRLILAVTLTMVAVSAFAFPPRMHSEHGTVKAINPKTQTITLQVCCETEQFTWRGWTRIRIDGKKVVPENIVPGTPVRVSFRHEAGLQSLYDVRSIAPRTTCADCIACAR